MPTQKPKVVETETVVNDTPETLRTKIIAEARKSRTRWIVGGVLGVAVVAGSVAKAYFNNGTDAPSES